MRLNSLAHRYAQAIFNSAQEKKITDSIMSDLTLIEETILKNSDFLMVLNSPIISKEKKKSVLKDLFASKVQPVTVDFLCLIVDKNRENVLLNIKEEFHKLYNEANSLSNLIIESVIKLSDEQISAIKNKMEKKYNKSFTCSNVLNENLIGGVRLLFDDNIIDGSVRSKLAQIEEALNK